MIDHDYVRDSKIPKVSILLPNLNTRPFLEERIQTIYDQTFTDWELIIVDNYSDDGAWEYFQECARKDARIHISQAPRAGMYANWNNCIRLARGEYVYIATSDDTMSPDCLEKMAGGLDRHLSCDLCHCCLTVIDEQGHELEGWWLSLPPQVFYGSLVFQKHIRKAPLDGVLHGCLNTIYHSITQLLIRRTVFARWGVFRTDWGSRGDFEWEMRASLACDTLHIPEYLASWRIHPTQATSLYASDFYEDLAEMVVAAVDAHATHLGATSQSCVPNDISHFYRKEALLAGGSKKALTWLRVLSFFERVQGRAYRTKYRIGRRLGRRERLFDARSRYALRLLRDAGVSLDTHVRLL